jgi:hypothetical protein
MEKQNDQMGRTAQIQDFARAEERINEFKET